MKKKIVSIILSAIMLVLQFVPAYGAIGDVEGYTTYTDILAYINNYLIESYNINGYTVVIAEDLVNYGFNVEWNDENRTLNITRNYEQNEITPYSTPYETAPNMVGKSALPILSTDIRTLVNGVEAKSYNIDGRTVVDIESLTAFGPVNWEPDFRYIKVWIEDGLEIRYYAQSPKSLPKTTLYSTDGREIEVYDYEVNDYLSVGWYKIKSEANELANAAKNREAVGKFYVGQDVVQWLLINTRYGIVRDIDASTGKIKVYWNKIVDNDGYAVDQASGRLFFGMYSETWVDATDINPLY